MTGDSIYQQVEQIARVCHEANRAYCATLGDSSQRSWEEAPEWQRQSAMDGVAFHLNHLANGVTPAPWESHNAWLKGKRDEGWTYGPVKDETKREHPCFVPYEKLPLNQRRKDMLFGNIVQAFVQ